MKRWVKLPIDRVLSLEFSVLSIEARDTWVRAYALAGKCDAGGFLTLKGVTLGREELYTPKIPQRRLDLAIDELLNHGWFVRHLDGALEVAGWAQDQDTKDATRQRKSRDNKRDSHAVSHGTSHADRHAEMWRNLVTNGVTRHDREYIEITSPGEDHSATLRDLSPSEVLSATCVADVTVTENVTPRDWQHAVLIDGAKIANVRICDFEREQRYVAARVHCLLFGGCTVNEKSNRSNASKVAAGFTSFGADSTYGDMTFREYVSYAFMVHKRGDGAPWFNVWLVKGVVEFERV